MQIFNLIKKLKKYLPIGIKENQFLRFIFFRAKRKHYQISYSQQGEDLTLLNLMPFRKNGFFVDVGAFHPIKYSNTYLFYLNGWSGINIEPNPDVKNDFLKLRKRDINLSIGIGNLPGKLKYYKFNDAALNTFSKEHADKWKKLPNFHITDIGECNIDTLKNIFSIYLPKGKKIDFMSVDVENFDLQVLEGNDWDVFRPSIIAIEEDLLQLKSFSDSSIFQFLSFKNYSLVAISNGTIFFKDLLN